MWWTSDEQAPRLVHHWTSYRYSFSFSVNSSVVCLDSFNSFWINASLSCTFLEKRVWFSASSSLFSEFNLAFWHLYSSMKEMIPWLLEANCMNLLSRRSALLRSLSRSLWHSVICASSSVLTFCRLWHWRVSSSALRFRMPIRLDCSLNLDRSTSVDCLSVSPPAEKHWSSTSDLWILSIVWEQRKYPSVEKLLLLKGANQGKLCSF